LASCQLAARASSVSRNDATAAFSDRAPPLWTLKLLSEPSFAPASERILNVLPENKMDACGNAIFHIVDDKLAVVKNKP